MRKGTILVALTIALIGILLVIPSITNAEEDKATWYGPGFHGRTMANGQVFDMYDPTTTASNRFPFGTWLKVTSIRTGRSVVVQVRDRGGFDHAVDLSYAAFAAIDDPARMMIPIHYEVVPGPDGSAPPAPAPPPAPTPAPAPEPANPELSARSGRPAVPAVHVVQPGETLANIAARYELTSAELVKLNGITNANLIRPGQQLKLLPDAPQSTPTPEPAATHVVQPGETLSKIAALRGVPIGSIITLNNLSDPNTLRPGQQLKLPAGEAAPAPAPTPAPQPESYVVQAGDTLGAIARTFGTTVDALLAANGLGDADIIVAGQKLTLPNGSAPQPAPTPAPPPTQTYVVEEGDTLSGIAAQFGTTADELLALNGLDDSDYLVVGQELEVPAGAAPTSPVEVRTYTVQPGDTLSDIAAAHGTTSNVLVELNGLSDPDQIRPGDELRLP